MKKFILAFIGALALFIGFHAAGFSDPVSFLIATAPAVAVAKGSGMPGRGYLETANILTGGALNQNGNTTFGKDFPMGEGWFKMLLRFNHVLTIGTGTTAVTEGELLIIKGVLFQSDRGEVFCNLPGRAIYKIAIYQTGQVPRKDAIAASNGTYRVTLPIIFADLRMNRPVDTSVDTSRYNACKLIVTYGGVADILGTPGTATLAPTLDIDVERTLGKLPPKGKPMMHVNYQAQQPVDASVLTSIDLERSADMNVKRLFVHSCTSGTAGQPWSGANSDAIINVIQVQDQNRNMCRDRIWAMIQDGNKVDALLESVISGVIVFDFVRDGSITSALQTGNKSVFKTQWTNQGGVAANSLVTATGEQIRTLK